jgi:hypothetical protein
MSGQANLKAMDHPLPENLLLALEGELTEKQIDLINEHLRTCWECRNDSEKLQNGIFAFMEFRNAVVLPRVGAPPGKWRTFGLYLDQAIDQSRQQTRLLRFVGSSLTACKNFRHRAHVSFSQAWRPVWIVAAATLILLLVVTQFLRAPVASASEVLARIRTSEQSALAQVRNPVIYQRIRISSRNRSVVREIQRAVFAPDGSDTESDSIPGNSEVVELRAQAISHRLRWEDPLNADSFAEWRRSLGQKVDHLILYRDRGVDLIELDTATSADALIREASITVRRSDWHPVAENIRFVDGIEFEMVELKFEVRAAISVLPPSSVGRPTKTSVSHASPSEPQIAATEVRVRAALHALGTDLGDPIEIRRTRFGSIRVEGLAKDEERRKDLMAALIGIPHVEMSLRLLGTAPVGGTSAHTWTDVGDSGQTSKPALDARLQEKFADPAERGEFINQMLAASQESLVRAWALRRLAERYNASEIGELDSDSRETVKKLLEDHLGQLRQQLAIESRGVEKLFGETHDPSGYRSGSASADWQTGVIRVFAAVDKFDHTWTVALAGSNATSVVGETHDLSREGLELQQYVDELGNEISIMNLPERNR